MDSEAIPGGKMRGILQSGGIILKVKISRDQMQGGERRQYYSAHDPEDAFQRPWLMLICGIQRVKKSLGFLF